MKKTTPEPRVLDEAACIYGAGVLLKHVQALAEEVQGVRAGSADIEFVHRARVASRRLRAALPLFQTCVSEKKARKWLAEIRQVTRALGEARDTDVQLERLEKASSKLEDGRYRPGISRLVLRLRQQRARLQAPAGEAVDHLLQSRALDDMSSVLSPLAERAADVYLYTPSIYQHSFQSILGRLEAFLAYEAILRQPEKVEELHQMRIAAKWLRYTLETFAPLYASQLKPQLLAVRKAQELLGDIHDCDVWQIFLPRFLADERQRILDYFGHARPYSRLVPGIQYFAQDCQQARGGLYEEFVTCWDGWQAEQVWTQLRQTIQVPFLQPQHLYPPSPPGQESLDPPAA